MKKLISPLLIFFIFQHASAQQFNNWYFGLGAGISFNPGGTITPHALTDGINTAHEGCASVSDGNANILFYTNGRTVYNRLHQVMLNGDSLAGHESAVQSSIIIPVPNNDSIYYIFTTDAFEDNFAGGYHYSIVNIKHDGGKGEVITKNILLNASCTERLTAARHANGIDVWIICNENASNSFKAWLLTCNGLQPNPVVSITGVVLDQHIEQNIGSMKLSPDGKQLCQTHFPDLESLNPENFFQLFDFNNATGILSNPKTIAIPTVSYHACEFSPDSKLLYVTRVYNAVVDQFESTLGSAAAITASRISIPAVNGIYGIQAGPDEKIYLNHFRTRLSVISKPNIKGLACLLEKDKIDLDNALGALGLPAAINDWAFDPYNNFTYTIVDSCNAVVQFNGQTNLAGPVQWSWEFADGGTSNIQNPQHSFSPANAPYKVKLTIRSPSVCGFIERTKDVIPAGAWSEADFDFVTKCDSGYVRFINQSNLFPDRAGIFIWNFGDGDTSSQNNPTHSYQAAGSYFVKLKIKTGLSCLDDSITKPLDLRQLSIQASPDQIIDIGQTVQLNVNGGGSRFTWSPALWLNNPNIANPIAKPQDDIMYVVTVSDDAGCIDSDTVFIKVNQVDGIFVPTAFTPNNDGLNDILKPFMGFKYDLIEFSIFNRWGEKVFSTTEKDNGWDGKTGGRLQNSGSYIWIIKVKDKSGKLIQRKGLSTLIR